MPRLLTLRDLGPRAKRRLVYAAAGVLALLVAGGLVLLVVLAPSSSSSRASRKNAHPPLGEQNLGIVYGATATQVLKRLASPNQKQAACWIYNASGGKVNGIPTFHDVGGMSVDGMKYCFLDGVVSDIEWHFQTYVWRRRAVPAHWGAPLDFGTTLTPPNVMAG